MHWQGSAGVCSALKKIIALASSMSAGLGHETKDAIVNRQADPRAVVAALMERDKRTEVY